MTQGDGVYEYVNTKGAEADRRQLYRDKRDDKDNEEKWSDKIKE